MASKYMSGEEFIRKVLDGERDFNGVIIEKDKEEYPNLSIYDGYQEMQDYLKRQNLKKNPLHLSHADLRGIRAKGIYLPYAKAEKANLWGAYLPEANLMEADLKDIILCDANLENAILCGSNLSRADLNWAILYGADIKNAILWKASLDKAIACRAEFSRADLSRASLYKTDLTETNLSEAILCGAEIVEANLNKTNLWKTDLTEAYLTDVKMLEDALNLRYANFNTTRVTPRDAEILRKAGVDERGLIIIVKQI
jgi:uncharacterized protein YjbI with pentapeptide repeats